MSYKIFTIDNSNQIAYLVNRLARKVTTAFGLKGDRAVVFDDLKTAQGVAKRLGTRFKHLCLHISESEQVTASAAAHLYIERKNGQGRPLGKTGGGGRWYPDDREFCDCCENVRSPSRAWPWSLYKHCFSVDHAASLFNADATTARKIARQLQKQAA